MTTFTRDDDSNEYLWDRSGPVDSAVADFERALGPLAYQPARHPLRLPPARRHWPVITAIAASVVLAAAASLLYWRLAWPAGRAWPMELAGQSGAFAVGQTLRLDGASSASIDVARLGTMRVLPNSTVTLNATASTKHRLRLDRGSVRVSVWAPPSRVVFTTPSGEVIDLGCVFTLSVDETGRTHVAVETGWVQLENGHGEVLVPAGASTAMAAAGRPLVPIFDDASGPFRDGVRAMEAGPIDDSAAWRNVRRDARPRDVLTLLMLALRLPERRGALLEHAATLAPPPQPPAGGVASLDNAAVWEWFGSLPLPPAKAWWRNWKDVFRR
jgi:ferric-dicitrate binding protein FerR (iron transport regulator)